MIDFYNAFISYKHAPLDISIAEHVQKKLEHFHVPHKLKKKLKHQKITRIFRDKDELPITSDLTETITEALEKAEYLIVICSTNTSQSMWVKREIATFLKFHTADKILTVLCDGEPEEVIPSEILSTQKTFVDAAGNTQTVTVPVEPLSCDYRMSKSKADREELPRLASALLGCSYDELQRRRRQYRIRRAAAIVAAAFVGVVAFGAYMSYKNRQIDRSYIESLRSRSVYLANESRQLLGEGKRTDALQLALAALPTDKDDKTPVTGDAIRAITDATAAYKSNSGLTYEPIWNFKTENTIKKILLNSTGEYLAAYDRIGNIYVWNALSHDAIFKYQCDIIPETIAFMDKDSIIVTFEHRIEVYNIQSGKLMWGYDVPDELLREDSVYCAANCVYFNVGSGQVVRLSAKDGSVKDTFTLIDDLFLKDVELLTVSADGKKLAYADSQFNYNGDSLIHIYDIETGKDYSAAATGSYISSLVFIDDEHLCAISNDDMFFSSVEYTGSYTYISEGRLNYTCFDTTMKKQWDAELIYNDVAQGYYIFTLPQRNAMVCYAGNSACIVDVATGTVINKYNTGSSIISVSDWNENGIPEFICSDGDWVLAASNDSNDMAVFSVLGQNLDFGIAGDFIYVVEEGSNDIICFSRFLQDDDWQELDGFNGNYLGTDYQAFYADEEYLIIAATLNDSTALRVSIIDAAKGKLLSQAEIPDVEGLFSSFKIVCSGDKYFGVFGSDIYNINPKKGTVEKSDLTLKPYDVVTNGKIVATDIDGSMLNIEVTDIDGSHSKLFEIEDVDVQAGTYIRDCTYVESLNKLFVPVGTSLYVIDMGSSKTKEIDIPDSFFSTRLYNFYVETSSDGSQILMCDGHTIIVTDDSFKTQYSLTCQGLRRFGACFRNGILYIIEDNYLVMYKGDTGELIGKYEMSLYGIGHATLTFDDSYQQLYVQAGSQISIMDTNTRKENASIENVYCYNELNDRFYVYSFIDNDYATAGYIKHYTLNDLIEKAKRYLGNHEIDDITRYKYGL